MVSVLIEVSLAILIVAGGLAVLVETVSAMTSRTAQDRVREHDRELRLDRDRRQSVAWAQAAFQARVRKAQGVGAQPAGRKRKAG